MKKAVCFRKRLFSWQGSKDSNSGHAVLETAALPTELHPYILLPGSPERYGSIAYFKGKCKSFFKKSCSFFAFFLTISLRPPRFFLDRDGKKCYNCFIENTVKASFQRRRNIYEQNHYHQPPIRQRRQRAW